MGENSKIEWCDHTMNFWIGCTEAGPECDHCYARELAGRYGWAEWGPGKPRHRTKDWSKPAAWDRKAAKLGIRYRVFTNSLSDWADKEVPDAWRDDAMAVIEPTSHLNWLILTKRPNVLLTYAQRRGGLPSNVWAGTTIGSKDGLNRLALLKAIDAKVRFLSIEPLLEDLGEIDLTGIHWVIVGGESGKDARPMHPDWALSLRDQCQAVGVPFFFKQWGEWTPGVNVERHRGTVASAHWFDNKWLFGTENLAREDGHIDDEPDLYRVGKKAAGRLLDGREWNQVPS